VRPFSLIGAFLHGAQDAKARAGCSCELHHALAVATIVRGTEWPCQPEIREGNTFLPAAAPGCYVGQCRIAQKLSSRSAVGISGTTCKDRMQSAPPGICPAQDPDRKLCRWNKALRISKQTNCFRCALLQVIHLEGGSVPAPRNNAH